jgi:4-hydroxybenzoate polyprenyltransferase
MKEAAVLKARTEEDSASAAIGNTKFKNNIVSPVYIDVGTLLGTDTPLEADQPPLSIDKIFPREPNSKSGARIFFKAIRVHHWTKNLLVFVPLLLSSTLAPSPLFFSAVLAFFSLSLCASGVYLLNDLADSESDLPILTGVLPVSLLLLASVVLSLFLPLGFLLVLATYFVFTLAYWFYSERNMLVETSLLALLYLSCIIAGATAVQITLSPWSLIFSLFLFLCLTFVKRLSIWLILLWAWGLF